MPECLNCDKSITQDEFEEYDGYCGDCVEFVECPKHKFSIPRRQYGKCPYSCWSCRFRSWLFHKIRKLKPKIGLCMIINCFHRVHKKGASWCKKHQDERDEMYADEDYENMMLDQDDWSGFEE